MTFDCACTSVVSEQSTWVPRRSCDVCPEGQSGDLMGSSVEQRALSTTDRREPHQARQVVMLLHRAYQAFELYPDDHQVIEQFSQDLFAGLQAFFGLKRTLHLRLERFRVYYQNHLVLEEESVSKNFIFLLFSNGIRRLLFSHGLSHTECLRFFGVLHRCSRIRSIYEDAVTLMWEADFKHIRYLLVEDLSEVYLAWPFDADGHDALDNLEIGVEPPPHDAQTLQVAESLARARLALNDDELEELEELIEREEGQLMYRFLDIVARTLEHASAVPRADKLLTLLGHVQPQLLANAEIRELILCFQITVRLVHIFEKRQAADQMKANWGVRLRRIAGRAANEQVLINVLAQIDAQPDHEMLKRSLFRYVQIIEAPSNEPLLKGFLWAKRPGTRRYWCHVLARKFRHEPRQLWTGIRNAEWMVVRNVLWVLGTIGSEECIALLDRGADHAEPRVRSESLRGLLKINRPLDQGARLQDVILRHLDDRDPEVRRAAIKAIPQVDFNRLRLMRAIFRHRGYDRWTLEDRRLFFYTVVRMGDDDVALMALFTESMVDQYGGVLSRLRGTEVPRQALEMLHRHPSPQAIDAFQDLYQRGPRTLRRLCETIVYERDA